MKALLIVFFLPNANTSATVQPDFSAVEIGSTEACQVYADAITALHAGNEDPRTLKVSCQPSN